MFARSLKIIAGSLLVCAVVWTLTLAWWQSNDHEPNRVELALYLGALPLAFVGGFILLHAFIEHLKASPPPPAPIEEADPLVLVASRQEVAERSFRICLLDVATTSRVGSVDKIENSVIAGARPEPSNTFVDSNGFPVFVGEIEQLATEALIKDLQDTFKPDSPVLLRTDILRALSALDQTLQAMIENPLQNLGRPNGPDELEINWLWPNTWPGNVASELVDWLRQRYWPTQPPHRVKVSWQPVSSDGMAMTAVDEIVLRLARNPDTERLVLLLAATSRVDAGQIAEQEEKQQLFTSQRQTASIPGEGAVALLFSTPSAQSRFAYPKAVQIARVSIGRRDKSIDAGGRIQGDLIEQLSTDLLQRSARTSEQVVAGFADTDHRANHCREALDGLGRNFPHWEVNTDFLPIGSVTGCLSPFGGLVALAAAQHKAIATESAVLCLSNQHETERAVALVFPLPSPAEI